MNAAAGARAVGLGGGHRLLRIEVPACLAFVALAALVFSPRLGSLSALLFILAGGTLLVSDIEGTLRALAQRWYLLCLPAYCLISVFWSQFPGNTFYYGTQFAFTVAVAVVLATRVEPRSLLRAVFAAAGLGIVASLAVGYLPNDGTAWRGIFDSKNAFAGWVAIFLFAAAALALDSRTQRLLRLAAIGGVLVSVPLLAKSQAVGVSLLIGPCVAAMILVVATRYLSAGHRVYLALILAAGVSCAALIGYAAWSDILGMILNSSGKDMTLTGRTELWAAGTDLIAQRPLLGVGYRGFWVLGNPEAERLWHAFGVPSGAGFSFHNTYISNAVDLGIVGVTLEVVVLYGALLLTGIRAVREPSATTAFFFAHLLLVVLQSFTEVTVFFEFSVPTILTLCSIVYAVRPRRAAGLRWRTARSRPTQEPAR